MQSFPRTLWLTGLSGAGKSTLARHCWEELRNRGFSTLLLDGDRLRAGLCADLGFAPAARRENIRRAAELAALANAQGFDVIAALISPLRGDRELARQLIGEPAFVEVHVSTALSVCEERDPKGLYRRARSGELHDFTGVSAPYEVPMKPQLRIDTAELTTAQGVAQLLNCLGR
ncbi:MAG: adenylyl-sulfate kinase [Inhella sp.]